MVEGKMRCARSSAFRAATLAFGFYSLDRRRIDACVLKYLLFWLPIFLLVFI